MAYTEHPVWTFPNNWSQGVLETLEFKTDVLTSEVGAEQRISKRLTPRRSMETSFLIQKENRQYLQHLLGRYGSSVWLIPLWHQVAPLDAAVALGATSLSFDTRLREYKAGDFVVIRHRTDARIFEAIEIASVSDSELILISNTERAWPRNDTYVYPARLGRLADLVQGAKKTDELFEVKARFNIAQINPYPSGWVSATYLDGLVLETRPDDSEDLSFDYQRNLLTLDNDLAIPEVFDAPDKAFRKMQYRWSFIGREAYDNLKQMLYWLRGRTRSFWLPTFMADFTLAVAAEADDTTLTVKNVGYTRTERADTTWTHLRIETLSGAVSYHHIVSSVEDDASTETLTLEAPLTSALSVSSIRSISYLIPVRLDQDVIELNHPTDTDGLTQCVVTFAELPTAFGVAEEIPVEWGDLWLTSVYDLVEDNKRYPTYDYIFMENENELLVPVYSDVWDVANEEYIYGFEWRRHSADDFEFIDPIPARLTGVTVANPSGTVTRMTKAGHGFITGDIIIASEFSSWLNGAWHITVVDADHFDLVGAVWEATVDASGTVNRFTDDWDTDNGGEFIDDPDGYVWICGAYSAYNYRIDKSDWSTVSAERSPISVEGHTLTTGYFVPRINPYNNDLYMHDQDSDLVMHRINKGSPTFQPAQSYYGSNDNLVLDSPFPGVIDTHAYYADFTPPYIQMPDTFGMVFVSATEAYLNDFSNSNIFHLDLTTGIFTYQFRLVNGAGNFSMHRPVFYDEPTNTLWFWGTNNAWYELFLGEPIQTANSLRAWVVGSDPATIIDYPLMWDHQMVVAGTEGDQDYSYLSDSVVAVDKYNRGIWIGYSIQGPPVPQEAAPSVRFFSFVERELTHRMGDGSDPTPGYQGPFFGGDSHSGSHLKITSATTAWSLTPYVWNAPLDITQGEDYKAVKITYSAQRVLESARYVRVTIYGSAMQAHNSTNESTYYGMGDPRGTGLQEIEVHSELNGANVVVSVEATSEESGFPAANMLDGTILVAANSWRASSVEYPQVITMYLGPTALPVFEVQMWPINEREDGAIPSGASRAPGIFDIDVSLDGASWTHKRRYQGVVAWALGTNVSVDPPAARVFEAF